MDSEKDKAVETDNGLITISGIVDSVIYQNNENGYSVLSFEDTTGQMMVITGTLPYVQGGDKLTCKGQWTNHVQYGRQFKVESFDKSMPETTGDILRYLSSGVIKGVGAKTAQKIVDKFGSDTFEVIENHPDWLADIPGINPKKAKNISDSYKEISGSKAVMMFCSEYFTPQTSMKIYKKWGSGAVERIKRNPYDLCGAINGISFQRADSIAANLGIGIDSEDRIMPGIAHVLSNESQRGGHTCLPKGLLISCAESLLFDDSDRNPERGDLIRSCLEKCINDQTLIEVTKGENRFIYLPSLFRAETYIAKKLKSINEYMPKLSANDIPLLIDKAEAESGIKYADMQRHALGTALENGVMVLTGGPGTGKTTIIKGLISIFTSLDYEVCLAAPTGRAAKRMSEATSHEAKTIHRLLEMDASSVDDTPSFMRNENDKLDEDVIIIDEASMIDVMLMEALLKAVKSGARLILIGDTDQLPSVGCGNVLGDICSSEVYSVVRLTNVFRQSETSLIITNAHRINQGIIPDISRKDADFFYLRRETEDGIRDTVIDLVKNRLPKSYGADIQNRIQVISPARKGVSGTIMLNSMLQEALNPKEYAKREKAFRDIIFREGDRVMQTKNNYSLEWETDDGRTGCGVYNGDMGIITSINTLDEFMEIQFDDRRYIYDFTMLDELDHAYAVTVHKSQGSEYPVVIMPLFRCAPMLQTRNLLYTAVTRAAKMVILVGLYDVMENMVMTDRHSERCTLLNEYIKRV